MDEPLNENLSHQWMSFDYLDELSTNLPFSLNLGQFHSGMLSTALKDLPFSLDWRLTLLQIYPTVLNSVLDLKESSALRLTIALWNHASKDAARRFSQRYKHGMKHRQNCLDLVALSYAQVCQLIVELPVSKSISNYLVKYAEKMFDQMKHWVNYHDKTVSSHYGNVFVDLHHNIPYFSWSPYGTIDYKETALNLLSSTRLSNTEKYKLSCVYCLQHKIAELAPSLIVIRDSVGKSEDFHSQPMTSYWDCYFRQELPHTLEGLPLNIFMLQHILVDNWWSKEYFFDRLSREEKLPWAVWLIDQFGVGYQKLLLLKLNEYELVEMYKQRGLQIISNYSYDRSYAGEILPTWFEIRCLMNPHQLVCILVNLLRADVDSCILMEIWLNARDEFKYYISLYRDNTVLEEIFQQQIKNIDNNDGEFLFTVLSDVGISTKKEVIWKPYFRKYCDELFLKRKLPTFERLIEKLVKFEDSEELKQDLVLTSAALRDECFEFYSIGQLERANDLLAELFPSHPDLIREYKTKLLMAPDIIEKLANSFQSTWYLLNGIVADGLPTEDLKIVFRKSYQQKIIGQIFQLLMNDVFKNSEFLLNVLSDIDFDVKNCITRTSLFTECCEVLLKKHKLPIFLQITKYCLEDEELHQFRQDFVLDSTSVRKECLEFYLKGQIEPLNGFLMKLLPSSPGVVQEYKTKLLMSSDTITQFVYRLKSTWKVIDKILADGLPTEDLRTDFKRSYHHRIIFKIFQWLLSKTDANNNNDNEFLFDVLSGIDIDIRNSITRTTFFRSSCETLLQHRKFSTLERIIKECVKIEDLNQFGRDVLLGSSTVQNECLEFYSTGRIEFLNNFLNKLFLSRHNLVGEFKIKLLALPNFIEKLADSLDWDSDLFEIILTDGLPTDDLKTDFKKTFAFSSTVISILQWRLVNNELEDVKRRIDYYLKSDQDKKVLKKYLVTDFEDKLIIIFSKYDLKTIQRMLVWCLEDDESLIEYKSTLQVDAIFNKLLKDAVFVPCTPKEKSYNEYPEFVHVELFLNWYFENSSEVKRYKLKRIDSNRDVSCDIPVLKALLENNDKVRLGNMISWLFENDRVEIEKFLLAENKKHNLYFNVSFQPVGDGDSFKLMLA